MDTQHLIYTLFGIISTTGGFIMKALWNKQEKLNDDITNFREHVAQNYPSRDSVEKRLDKIDNKLDRLIEQRAND